MDVSLRCELAVGDFDHTIAIEVLSDQLFEGGATAVGEDSAGQDTRSLVAGFATEADARSALTAVAERYGHWIEASTIAPGSLAWAHTQRDGLEPKQIGPWYIRTPWDPERPDIDALYDIVIDPGVAFGHGAHPSTVMAIELMLRSARHGRHLLDVGTGTAVIAIIAARLGMSVTAVEADDDAVDVARLNIARNATIPHDDISALIDLRLMDATTLPSPAVETLVVANVTMDVQRKIAQIMSPSSTIITSGILCRQVPDVLRLYPDHEGRTIRTHGEWASIELRRHKRLTDEEKR